MSNADYLRSRGWKVVRQNRMGNRVQFVWAHPRYGSREFEGTEFALYADARMPKDATEDDE